MTISNIAILAGAEIADYTWLAEHVAEVDMVICADSGLRHARAIHIVPDLVIGDFDSVDPYDLQWAKEKQITIVEAKDQDKTDLQKSLDQIVDYPDATVAIYGALGGRLDHQFANILILERFENISRFVLADKDTETRLLDGHFQWSGEIGDIVGVVPLREVQNLRYTGLQYPADGLPGPYTLGWLGTSNVMTGTKASVDFNGGLVLWIHTRER